MAAEEEEEEEEEEEYLLHLFNLYWFKQQILTNPYQKQTCKEEQSSKPINPSLQVITPSIDHHLAHTESPTSVLALFKETEQFSDEEAVKKSKKKKKKNQRRKKAGSKKPSRSRKSLTELEHEELKGFMELGFEFSEEAKESPWLLRILPGLQKQARVDVSRPYLSESWKKMMMMNWKLPSLSNENDMKKHLRIWAHAVASVAKDDNGIQSVHLCNQLTKVD